VALVRVYCGLASADRTAPAVQTAGWLTAAVVDDAGRLLDVCEIGDDPAGYARLCTVLAERSGGPTSVAIAADSDDHRLTMLLTAAGRALAIADDDAVDDYAERFADDESADEMESPPAERRAVGLARALQAGALSAVSLPAPRDLAGLKGVLVAHAALVTGRHSAAVALREVLRELHPAALRAYPDPAEQVPLAVLDALPEPHSLGGGTSGRARESAANDAAVADIARSGVADQATVKDAITALRVAIAETPRRAGSRSPDAAIGETIRQAVAAVRACDAACQALVSSLAERLAEPAPATPTRVGRRAAGRGHAAGGPDRTAASAGSTASTVSTVSTGRRAAPEPVVETTPVPTGRRARSQPAATPPAGPSPAAAPPAMPRPLAPPVAPAAAGPGIGYSAPLAPAAAAQAPAGPAPSRMSPDLAPVSPPPWVTGTGSNRPVSAPPPPPPGITPITPGQRHSPPPGEPFRPPMTTAASMPGLGRDAAREQATSTNSTRATRAAEGRQSVAAAIESRSQALRAIRRRSVEATEDRDAGLREGTAGLREGTGTAGLRQGAGAGQQSVVAAVERRGARGRRGEQPGDTERWADEVPEPTARYSATDYTVPVPTPRPDAPAPGSRGNWPLASPSDGRNGELAAGVGPEAGYPSEMDLPAARLGLSSELDGPGGAPDPIGSLAGGRVKPPWQADDLPPEPPTLRLVEPPPLADRALREDRLREDRLREDRLREDRLREDRLREDRLRGEPDLTGDLAPTSLSLDLLPSGPERSLDPAPLRLVGSEPTSNGNGDWGTANGKRGSARRTPVEGPVSGEGDGDLLIFAEAKSAWFVGHDEDEPDWDSIADFGWRAAAEQAARPAVGAETSAGLPRRVPQANLLPGSPLSSPDRPLRIVRDAASIAAHTSGYFRGWRRGQEINGYAVGGRPGRESAGGWDFSRDTGAR
jgi:hypothetical protein